MPRRRLVSTPEAAQDLVRAREDVRGDLMRCRHRLSKLLPFLLLTGPSKPSRVDTR
jgi:hypothetical protein